MIDINKIPKVLVTAAFSGHSKEAFMFILFAGEQQFGFAATPTQMKAILEMFKTNVSLYETKYGIIHVEPSKILSPIQMDKLDDGKH